MDNEVAAHSLKSGRHFLSIRSMKASQTLMSRFALVAVTIALTACSELRARTHAREGNRLYQEGEYRAAVREYEKAQGLQPDIVAVLLNKGLACRQLLLPGAHSAEDDRAVDCALDAFRELGHLTPDDPRGKQLYVQTLFDAERYRDLESMYLDRLKKKPNDRQALHALVQVYSRWGRWRDAVHWARQRARQNPRDVEAHYSAAVMLYNVLAEKGGSGDNASYDPRPTAAPDQPPPNLGPDDIAGAERVQLAEAGIEHLEQALKVRPNNAEAMTYLGLLYRQRAIGMFEAPSRWQESIDRAESWRRRAESWRGTAEKASIREETAQGAGDGL
jgi:tetratricopeptide (TPR) repeat protein